MKKVVIIGAGIAGLACGIYARFNGFDTEIYEMHTMPGGECTGWDRGEYYFDGCINWLTGSKEAPGFHDIWRDTGALDDTVKIMHHEVFSRYEEDGRAVNVYADVGLLEKHLIEISPRDKKEIKTLCRDIKVLGGMAMPIDKPMDMMRLGDGLKMAAKLGPFMKMLKYGKMPMEELAAKFQEPLIQQAIMTAVPGDNPAMALVMALAGMSQGDCGYPLGGSRALARRMEARYLGLGGKVAYKAPVDMVLVEDGRAVGVRLKDGTEVKADYVVSCADAYATFTHMLGDRYTPDMYRNLFQRPKEFPTYTCALVYMGVNAPLTDYRSVTVKRREPVTIAGCRSEYGMILNYSYEPASAPEGKTVVASYYETDYGFWDALDKDQYAAEKKKLLEDAQRLLYERYPEARDKVEVTDVVTPKTYERLCGAWRGSWMSWGRGGKEVPQYYPGVLPGLANFILAGMWTLPPGGLPGAGASGRFAAHRLCMMEGMEFKTA